METPCPSWSLHISAHRRSNIYRFDPEGEADTLAHRCSRLRHGMRVVQLGLVVHHQETARLEINVDDSRAFGFRADGHLPGSTERNQRNRETRTEFAEVVIMWSNA